jgi:hypothetical protein
MWLSEPLPFIQDFIIQLDAGLQVHQPNRRLSRIQLGMDRILFDVGY